jgi:hypothetical protein
LQTDYCFKERVFRTQLLALGFVTLGLHGCTNVIVY